MLLRFCYLTCLSLTNYLISKLQLPYIGVISAIVDSLPKWVLIVWPKIPQMPQNLSAQFVCPSPNVLDFNEKRLSPCLLPLTTYYQHQRSSDIAWPIYLIAPKSDSFVNICLTTLALLRSNYFFLTITGGNSRPRDRGSPSNERCAICKSQVLLSRS